MRLPLAAFALAFATHVSPAQTPPGASAPPAPPKRIPVPGLTLTDAERAELTTGAAALRADLDALARKLAGKREVLALLPDAEIFHKAVDWALRYDEFMAPKETAYARTLLARGRERAAHLRAGGAPWLAATGTILRGHRSALDGSVQPYAVLVPTAWPAPHRQAMVWLLGRGEKRTELAFLAEREAGPPHLVPKDTLVLVPYGRFCNATKFAGEADVFEALAAVHAQYHPDPNRIAVAGFSMGGGSTWHLAVHHAGLWAVASPGAGFAETPIFTKALAPGKEPRPAWEQRLWRQYEATGLAANLTHLPTLAYTGELDAQKEASDLMAQAMAQHGLALERFIGPQTAHKFHDATKAALTARLEEFLTRGRDPQPAAVRFATYTLRYPEAQWVRIEGLAQHWELADVDARFTTDTTCTVTTRNVTALTLARVPAVLVIDGQTLAVPAAASTAGSLDLVREGHSWRLGSPPAGPRKRPGLTGPVDDAFVEPFLFVRPTGKPLHAETGTWVESELTQARHLWRDVFRGHAPVKADRDVTDADLAGRNLVLWGDPSSNSVLARLVAQLPVQWDAKTLTFRGASYDAKQHMPILVFPNPLNPARYVVLNSGPTFRADGYGNNALQTPKLPDWAVVDLRTPPGPRWPGKIAAAGFFDESWK
jgi:dienelactone hydrolase